MNAKAYLAPDHQMETRLDAGRCVSSTNSAHGLTEIYEPTVNMAIWRRALPDPLRQYVAWLSKQQQQAKLYPIQRVMSLDAIEDTLNLWLPDHSESSALITDVCLLVDMFGCLFDMDAVGLRLTTLTTAMCPRFHTDHVACRLLTTYGGPGTEWLPEACLDRQRLGMGSGGRPDTQSGLYNDTNAIQQLTEGHVALLKGAAWPGNEQHGAVHRSPALAAGEFRLLLSLDFA
ncbi:DUF1826 domain-containing protein [Allohahella marinimesophila]|uniref:DUF1826 domain-containing protein n=1 Tax=Allohahella marinimesophila TaxID=1054972 RepID=A0ABP7NSR1_9GAMM